MDLESVTRWEDDSRAKDEMMLHTDIPEAPWFVVESDDKRRARINMIAHLLSTIHHLTTTSSGRRWTISVARPMQAQGYDAGARGRCRPTLPDHAARSARPPA